MKEIVLIAGAFYGATAVILGAFGAHALKKIFSEEQLKSFETGVRYQMYHAIVLLVIGFNLNFLSDTEKWGAWAFITGIFLFSFSIYGLCYSSAKNRKMKFLGPVTPLGGLFLLSGWIFLFFSFI